MTGKLSFWLLFQPTAQASVTLSPSGPAMKKATLRRVAFSNKDHV
jgi:hypothetical protein